MDKRYLSCAETAKLVRKALGKAFPDQKFYVTSDTYAGGASIDVNWIDGPTTREVDSVIKPFEGADFDGSIDLKCYWYHWLLPDGSVTLARGSGTESSLGYIRGQDNPKPHPDAELVSMGADFIHGSRSESREFLEMVAQELNRRTGWEIPEIKDSNWYAGGKSRPGAAYFIPDYDKKAPGSHEPLSREFSQEAWKTSVIDGEIVKTEKVFDLWKYDLQNPDNSGRAESPSALIDYAVRELGLEKEFVKKLWPRFERVVLGRTLIEVEKSDEVTSESNEPDNGNSNGKPVITIDRDWVWVHFPEKPGENTLRSLREIKSRFGGGYSGKRESWYFKSLKAQPLVEIIADTQYPTWKF